MNKFYFSIIPIIFLTGCAKSPSTRENIEKKMLNVSYSGENQTSSMLVDIHCEDALEGENDWDDKNVKFDSNTPIKIVQSSSCSLTITKYTLANGDIFVPKNKPLVLNITESGTGSSESSAYKNSANNEIVLFADATNYKIGLYEKNNPIKNYSSALQTSSDTNLAAVFSVINTPKKIGLTFKPTFGSLNKVTVDITKLNTTFPNAWSIEGSSSCTNIINSCNITLVFNPPKATSGNLVSVLNVSYNNGSLQNTQIPIQFSASTALNRSTTPSTTIEYNEEELLKKYHHSLQENLNTNHRQNFSDSLLPDEI
ncbi:hypothetical protein QEJ31_13270 [Pigmentibacter sp. JX0631]|uniref:hypothetical protein n=1 Tax=Pigmentibacter sp. JX0631 TaxID=2976982 RepID=UPI002468C04D|nr:hypothetical protein [Pigmentibacter sp. JX0631]WGL59494.1 hypothetical protein QEJ31_13270 [Pigmentibacter sp. JX0631]